MTTSKTKAMAFSLRPMKTYESRVEGLLDRGLGQDWSSVLLHCYMCCEHVPIDELASREPADVAEFFIMHSRKHHWQLRQMQPLKHMDIVAVGDNLYMLYSDLEHNVLDFHETQLPNIPRMILITLKENNA